MTGKVTRTGIAINEPHAVSYSSQKKFGPSEIVQVSFLVVGQPRSWQW